MGIEGLWGLAYSLIWVLDGIDGRSIAEGCVFGFQFLYIGLEIAW